jgi:hypothetical protein
LLASADRLGELAVCVEQSFSSTTRISQWAKERIALMRKLLSPEMAVYCLLAAAWLASVSSAGAEVMTFSAMKDATLFESAAGTLAAGAEDGVFVGRTGQPVGTALRRGLVEFDLSAIPDGATINSASLRLFTTMDTSQGPATTTVTLHRTLGDWGEGNSNPGGVGGQGGTAQTGDATWRYQFFATDPWSNLGGDFSAQASATVSVGSSGSFVTWESTAALVADVQAWADNEATNFGWLLRGSETVSRSARKFASSEFPTVNNRPLLTVDFSLPPSRTPGDLNGDGFVDRVDVALLTANYGTATTVNNFDLGEFSGDGVVGVADLAILQSNFSPLAGASGTAVPEPASVVSGLVGIGGIVIVALRRRT